MPGLDCRCFPCSGAVEVESLQRFLRANAPGGLLPWSRQAAAAEAFHQSWAEIEAAALALGLLPCRYQRNRQSISVEQQLRLFQSRVAVLGCGGLGGHVIEQLARLGIGSIVAIDPDVFEEHNLNRQLLSTIASLGQPKVEAARARVAAINPAVTLLPIRDTFAPSNGIGLLTGSQVVVDALDSVDTRLALAESCAELGIPLIHGAIAGWYGQVVTQYPGELSLRRLYPAGVASKGTEQQLGNPAFTPAVVASMETAEVAKALLGIGKALRGRVMTVNLLEMTFDEIVFEDGVPPHRAPLILPDPPGGKLPDGGVASTNIVPWSD